MPETPAGFVLAPTPKVIRAIVPRRFDTHLFVPIDQTREDAKDKAILTISRNIPNVITAHTSTVIQRSEVEEGAVSLYERFIVQAIEALDKRVNKN